MNPKLGDVQKMTDEENIFGMWDGCFWSRVGWSPYHNGWIIHDDILKRMRDHYES
jgi:hypothetical protein